MKKKVNKKTTNFGFEKVEKSEKTRRVGGVFSSVSGKYDLMNDLMSFGMHRMWKRYLLLVSKVTKGHKVLDIAGGTGDISYLLSNRVGENGKVVLCDINQDMLHEGRSRFIDRGIISNIEYVQADAENLPFKENYFDVVTMGFGLRNVTDKKKCLDSIYKVLKPGGRLLILEFSTPDKWLEPAYGKYLFKFIPWLGEIVTQDRPSYQYLSESILVHPDQEEVKQIMSDALFEHCDYFNLSAGIVAIHSGYKI